MTPKQSLPTRTTLVLSVLAVFRVSLAGVISLENDPHSSYHYQHEPHVSVASSFMHFRGPVEGPEFEVKVPYVVHHASEHNHLHGVAQEHEDEHELRHGYTVDYVAHPRYEFSYGVEDHHTGDFHGQKETRDGSSVSGEYSVKEPGGSVRVVTYRADKDGFHAVVHTSGKNDHSGSSYSPEAREQHQGHRHRVHEQIQVHGHEEGGGHELAEYAAGYGDHEAHD